MGIAAPTTVAGTGAKDGEHYDHPISKSSFLSGIQCKKLLWTQRHAKAQIPGPDAQTLATFEQGREVGLLARQLYPSGVDCGSGILTLVQAVAETQRLLEVGKPLYEPTFMAKGCFARADILAPAEDGGWDLIEVKSTTSAKDVHITDLAFQSHVTKGSGVPVRRCLLCHVNPEYVRHGEVDPNQLFVLEDVTAQVSALANGVEKSASDLKAILGLEKCPKVEIGPHCDEPYPCPLRDRCWSFLPAHSVFTLYRGGNRGFKLLADGITLLNDIPEDFALTDKQTIQRECVCSGKPHVNGAAVSKFLRRLKYPISFLDFETIGAAIPLFDGVKPYQQVPFQFSLHVVRAAGQEPEHFSFLADGPSDPRPEFMNRLRTVLPASGSVVAYNSGFEISRLKECAAILPEFGPWVKDLENRTVDLLQPFRNFYFYHPDQKGRCSMKATLPALTGSGYEHLEIQDGTTASNDFLRITFGNASNHDKAQVRQWLEEYCGLDTLGMLRVVNDMRRITA